MSLIELRSTINSIIIRSEIGSVISNICKWVEYAYLKSIEFKLQFLLLIEQVLQSVCQYNIRIVQSAVFLVKLIVLVLVVITGSHSVHYRFKSKWYYLVRLTLKALLWGVFLIQETLMISSILLWCSIMWSVQIPINIFIKFLELHTLISIYAIYLQMIEYLLLLLLLLLQCLWPGLSLSVSCIDSSWRGVGYRVIVVLIPKTHNHSSSLKHYIC